MGAVGVKVGQLHPLTKQACHAQNKAYAFLHSPKTIKRRSAPTTCGNSGKSSTCSPTMKPSAASMATRPCVSSDSRQRRTSWTEVALLSRLAGSKMFGKGSVMPGSVFASARHKSAGQSTRGAALHLDWASSSLVWNILEHKAPAHSIPITSGVHLGISIGGFQARHK